MVSAPVIQLPAASILHYVIGAIAVAVLVAGIIGMIWLRRQGDPRSWLVLAGAILLASAGFTGAVSMSQNADEQRSNAIITSVAESFGMTLQGPVPTDFGIKQGTWDTVGTQGGVYAVRCTLHDNDTDERTATLKLFCESSEIKPRG